MPQEQPCRLDFIANFCVCACHFCHLRLTKPLLYGIMLLLLLSL
nr:MAG TPA: enterotoxin [Caudoviricetes sp.]